MRHLANETPPPLPQSPMKAFMEMTELIQFGGSVGRMERRAKYAARVSRHRRECWQQRRKQHLRRAALFSVLALAGLVLLVSQIVSDDPWQLGVVIGAALCMPAIGEYLHGN